MRRSRWVLAWCWVLALLLAFCLSACNGSLSPVKLHPKAGAVPAPQAISPSCDSKAPSGHGSMGECTPKSPSSGHTLPYSPSQTCGDTSNNDPIYGSIWASYAKPCHYFKLNQGLGFIDRTAYQQVLDARRYRRGIYLGGYDFFEVCKGSPVEEAHIFYGRLVALHLLGPGTMPPAGDAEWPLSPPCSAATARWWIGKWVSTVEALTHRIAILYTGGWWFDPNVGCWWPASTYSWISGYGVKYPPMPCGRSELDLWQDTDSGFLVNGHYGDVSVYLHNLPLARFAHVVAPRPPKPKHNPTLLAALIHERTILRVRLAAHHCHKSGPHVHRTSLCLATWRHGDSVNHRILALGGR